MALVVDVAAGPLRARGGSVAAKIVEVLLANAAMHARKGPVTVRAAREGEAVVVTHLDTGRALGADLREKAFTLAGQHDLKGRPDGRYGRACGLFALRLACDAIGATVEAGGADGAATFTIRFAPA